MALKDDMLEFLPASEIKDLVKGIAREIENDHRDSEVVLICPLRGSILFASDLARELKLRSQIDFVSMSSAAKKGTVTITKDISLDIRGRDVIICEEIIDVGRKLHFLINRLLIAQPRSIKVATLLDKPARRELPVSPDYVGRTIEDRFVVGYGMDTDEVGRNYSNIYLPKN